MPDQAFRLGKSGIGPYTPALGPCFVAISRSWLIFTLWSCIALGQAQTTDSDASPLETVSCRLIRISKPSSEVDLNSTRRFIDDRLTVWRQRLKLDEWRISPSLTRHDDLKPRTLGGIRWDKSKKSAVIWILGPADYRLPVCEMLDDIEMTIVHELIHLKLASLSRSEASRSSEEHAVNGIAEALVALDRQK